MSLHRARQWGSGVRAVALVASLAVLPVWAAGFGLNVQSGRATGMAGAVSAIVDDASANYYNPAGLAEGGRGVEGAAGVSLILPQIHYTSPTGATTNGSADASPPPHVYARVGLLDWLAIGFGVFTPFGNEVPWPDGWAGQYLSTQATLQTFDFNLNVAVQPNPRLRLAFGIDVLRGTVYLSRNLSFVDTQGSVQLGGGAWGFGYNAGLQLEIVEHLLYLGAAVRSPIKMDFTGQAHFTGVPLELNTQLFDQPISAATQMPLTATFGLGVKIKNRVKIEADFNYVGWSTFTGLDVEFQGNPALSVPEPKQWWDVGSVSLGAEIDVSRSVQLRLGIMYDPTPSPNNTLAPDLPDASRVNVAAGIGWHHSSGFLVDLGFQFIALVAHTSTSPLFAGTYGGTAEVVSLTFGWRHTAAPPAPVATAMNGASAAR